MIGQVESLHTGTSPTAIGKEAEYKILSKNYPILLGLLLRSSLVQQELTRLNIKRLPFSNKTVELSPKVLRMLGKFVEREEKERLPERPLLYPRVY